MLMEGLGELASVTLHTDDGIVAQGVTRELDDVVGSECERISFVEPG